MIQVSQKARANILIIATIALIGFACLIYWDQPAFEAWKANLNPWSFFLLMAIAPAFGVPTSPFYILAGASFSPAVGLGGGALAIAANLLLTYAIGHSGLRRLIERLLRDRKFQLPAEPPKRPIRYTVLVKFAPGVPAFLKNYILVLSRVSFKLYFTASFIFSFAYAALFFFLGDALESQEVGKGSVVIAILIIAVVAIWFYRRRVGKKKKATAAQAKTQQALHKKNETEGFDNHPFK